MNDRIDWQLLQTIGQRADLRLHLAGTASRCMDKLELLLSCPSVVCHGVTSEYETLSLLQHMDAAIVAHIEDKVSRFMNPMKMYMYAAVGLPTLLPQYLCSTLNNVIFYQNQKHCTALLDCLSKRAKEKNVQPFSKTETPRQNESAYLQLLQTVRAGEAEE